MSTSANYTEKGAVTVWLEFQKRKTEEELLAKNREKTSAPARQVPLTNVYYPERSRKHGK